MARSLDISRQIDEQLVRLLETMCDVAAGLDIGLLVVGATARDLIFEHGYGIEPKRATKDVDFGVRVPTWAAFERLRDALLKTERFEPHEPYHRLVHQSGWPIDIVAFGPLEDRAGNIRWPPEHAIQMNVTGFEDAYRHAIQVRVREIPLLEVPFASIPGMAMLKLAAWNDRKSQNDAMDLLFLLEHYLDAGNTERLAEEHDDWLRKDDFDFEKSSARLLGVDIARETTAETRLYLDQILESEIHNSGRLELVSVVTAGSGRPFDEVLELFSYMRRGLRE